MRNKFKNELYSRNNKNHNISEETLIKLEVARMTTEIICERMSTNINTGLDDAISYFPKLNNIILKTLTNK